MTRKSSNAAAVAACERSHTPAAHQAVGPGLTAKQAMAAVQFLQRADLKGAEVPAFVEVMQALSALAQPHAGLSQQASPEVSAEVSTEGGVQ